MPVTRPVLLFALALVGCGDPCEDGSEPRIWYADLDGDGHGDPDRPTESCDQPWAHVAAPDDCDDGDPDRRPGIADLCDGVDDDCDGELDEDGVDRQLFFDADGDGYGSAVSWTGCGAPPSTLYRAKESGDCNDFSADQHPRNSERCNGVDDDCDGSIDEDAIDAQRLFLDEDGDGYGLPLPELYGCPGDPGTSSTPTDCDDDDDDIHPGAPERCNLVDDDCNFYVDDNPSDGGMYWVDYDGDGVGGTDLVRACGEGSALVHVDQYGFSFYSSTYYDYYYGDTYEDTTYYGYYLMWVLVVEASGDCDDFDSNEAPGLDEVCDGRDNDCDGLTDDNDPNVLATNTYYLDADSDGYGRIDLVAVACTQPPLYVTTAGDCDDSTLDARPFATEVCDGIDNDCDGLIDASDPNVESCP